MTCICTINNISKHEDNIELCLFFWLLVFVNLRNTNTKYFNECFFDYRSFYDHPTYFIMVNLGSEIETINLLDARDTLPLTMKVKISSVNSGYVTG